MTEHSPAAQAEPDPLTPRQLVYQEHKQRELACAAEIEAACARHGCQLQAQAVIVGDKVQTSVQIVALDVA